MAPPLAEVGTWEGWGHGSRGAMGSSDVDSWFMMPGQTSHGEVLQAAGREHCVQRGLSARSPVVATPREAGSLGSRLVPSSQTVDRWPQVAGHRCTSLPGKPQRVLGSFSFVWASLQTPRTVAHQAPLPMAFSRQEYWIGLPYPSPGDLPDPGIEPRSLALQVDSLLSEPPASLRSDPDFLELPSRPPPPPRRWGWEGKSPFPTCPLSLKGIFTFEIKQRLAAAAGKTTFAWVFVLEYDV